MAPPTPPVPHVVPAAPPHIAPAAAQDAPAEPVLDPAAPPPGGLPQSSGQVLPFSVAAQIPSPQPELAPPPVPVVPPNPMGMPPLPTAPPKPEPPMLEPPLLAVSVPPVSVMSAFAPPPPVKGSSDCGFNVQDHASPNSPITTHFDLDFTARSRQHTRQDLSHNFHEGASHPVSLRCVFRLNGERGGKNRRRSWRGWSRRERDGPADAAPAAHAVRARSTFVRVSGCYWQANCCPLGWLPPRSETLPSTTFPLMSVARTR